MKRFQIYLTDGQKKAIDKKSKDTGLSVAELIRRAIDQFIKGDK